MHCLKVFVSLTKIMQTLQKRYVSLGITWVWPEKHAFPLGFLTQICTGLVPEGVSNQDLHVFMKHCAK